MWTTVLVLAVAVNVEPTRIGLLPLLLSRPKPLLQLLAFLAGSMSVSLGFGLLVLFVFERNPFGDSSSNGGMAQILVGAVALTIAAAMAIRWLSKRDSAALEQRTPAEPRPPGRVEKLTTTVRRVLGRSRSPWLSGIVGVGAGLPSVDYLAVLLVIGTSGAGPTEQAAALVTVILLSSLVIMVPLVGYLVAPAKTLVLIDRFGAWTRSRSGIEYAMLLALIGILLIGLGWSHL